MLQKEEEADGFGIKGVVECYDDPFPGMDGLLRDDPAGIEGMTGGTKGQQIGQGVGAAFFDSDNMVQIESQDISGSSNFVTKPLGKGIPHLVQQTLDRKR